MSNNNFTYHGQGGSFSMGPNSTEPSGIPFVPTDPFFGLSSPIEGIPYPTQGTIVFSGRDAEYSISQLGSSKHIYYTPLRQDVIDLSLYFQDWGCGYRSNERQGTGYYVMEVYVPWDTISNTDFYANPQTTDIWEIVPNQNFKSIINNGILINPFNHPSVTGNFVQLPTLLQIAVQQAYQNNAVTITPPSSSLNFAPFIPYANQILNYLRLGVESVPSFTQTINRTCVIDSRNFSNGFNLPIDNMADTLNVQGMPNFIISTQDMINSYAIPDYIASHLLPSYQTQLLVQSIDPQVYGAFAGWLWQPESIQEIGRFKYQLKQSFTWDVWVEGPYYIFSPESQFPLVYSPSVNPSGYIPT